MKYKLLNDLISAIHFYFLLYWAKTAFDKSVDSNVKFGVFVKFKDHCPKPKSKTYGKPKT